MRLSKLHIFLLTFILFVCLSSSCEKHKQHPVPSTYANFMINIQTDPEFIRLAAPGNAMEISGFMVNSLSLGYDDNGVIIYNAGDNEFYVFDRTCPYDMPESVAVETDGTGTFATCPVCGTQYVLPSMGSPTTNGPGIWPLREFKVFYNQNTGVLSVYN